MFTAPDCRAPETVIVVALTVAVTVGSVAACAAPAMSMPPARAARLMAAIHAASIRLDEARGLQRCDIRSDPFD
jgi:hypothetical protein